MKLPLDHIKVLEMAGLAPAPFAGMIMADFGANVIRIDRFKGFSTDVLSRNKRSIAMDLKSSEAIQILLEMASQVDVILDPFRPGIMEKLGLGPDVLLKKNPGLIYARLSGFGQDGSKSAGHDINYLAISGALELMGRHREKPSFPLNILADFAGGGLMCVMGILMAIIERSVSGKGQVIDANLTSGTSYLTTFPYLMQHFGLIWEGERGTNMLDGGAHFYEVYETKDGKYMAVGAIEPQFYSCLTEKLNLLNEEEELPDQMDKSSWPKMKERFEKIFLKKTQAEWTSIFDGSDACVTPVLSFTEPVPTHNSKPGTTTTNQWPRQASVPQPAPILSRTPAKPVKVAEEPFLEVGKHSIEILNEFGFESSMIQQLIKVGAVLDSSLVASHL
ncbi:CoA-transferase family III domain-containing protein [Pilaira anomala]|nr:CoA-transferase family III domain-containing protein [Pilaira anomala]